MGFLRNAKEKWEKIFESNGKCALWIFPYHCIQFKNIMDEKEKVEKDKIENKKLMEKIVKATIRPKYLRIWGKNKN